MTDWIKIWWWKKMKYELSEWVNKWINEWIRFGGLNSRNHRNYFPLLAFNKKYEKMGEISGSFKDIASWITRIVCSLTNCFFFSSSPTCDNISMLPVVTIGDIGNRIFHRPQKRQPVRGPHRSWNGRRLTGRRYLIYIYTIFIQFIQYFSSY